MSKLTRHGARLGGSCDRWWLACSESQKTTTFKVKWHRLASAHKDTIATTDKPHPSANPVLDLRGGPTPPRIENLRVIWAKPDIQALMIPSCMPRWLHTAKRGHLGNALKHLTMSIIAPVKWFPVQLLSSIDCKIPHQTCPACLPGRFP